MKFKCKSKDSKKGNYECWDTFKTVVLRKVLILKITLL